jgi:hypothetical protein
MTKWGSEHFHPLASPGLIEKLQAQQRLKVVLEALYVQRTCPKIHFIIDLLT